MMNIRSISLKLANEFVLSNHRHNKPVQGHKWSLGLFNLNNQLIGVAIVGRPVARNLDNGRTIEVLRVCTNGERNSNSMLYGRVAKIAKLMGYEKVITYTLTKESGASLRAVGAKPDAVVKGQSWDRKKRPRESQEVFFEPKIRWILN